jgi:hypothetical protein
MKKRLAIIALAALGGSACTSKSTATGADAGSMDASSDAGGCAESLDAFCATLSPNAWPGLTCTDLATESQGIAALCSAMQGAVRIAAGCEGYDVLSINGIDTTQLYYYDAPTQKLVAIVGSSIAGTRCAGGPASLVPPSCAAGTYPCPATDGGSDAAPPEGGSTDAPADAPADSLGDAPAG